MQKPFKTVVVMGNHRDARALESVVAAVTHLVAAGCTVRVSSRLPAPQSPATHAATDDADLPRGADLVVAVGGDGTILYASRHAALHGVPVLGINRGRLGFLADVRPDDIPAALDEILAGQCSRERRMLLRAEIRRDGKVLATALAVNDIVIKRREPGRMLEFQTTVDGCYVNTHGGDGFIAATPTGSTAYTLSCGGPIVQPGLDVIVLAPICPHTLNDRPLVIGGNSVTELQILHDDGSHAEVSNDGESLGELLSGDVLRIAAATEHLELIHPSGYDYFSTLRSKLHWGRDNRVRGR